MKYSDSEDLIPLAQAMAGVDAAEKIRSKVLFAREVAGSPGKWGPESPPKAVGDAAKIIDGVSIDRRDLDEACEEFAALLHWLTRVEADNASKLRVLLGSIATLRTLAADGYAEADRLADPLEDWTRQHYRFNDVIPPEPSEVRKIAVFLTRRYDVIPRSTRIAYSEKGFDFIDVKEQPRDEA